MDYKKVEEFLESYANKIEEIKGSDVIKRFDEIRELALKIESLLTFVYHDDKDKIEDFKKEYEIKLNNFNTVRNSIAPDTRLKAPMYLVEILGYFKRILNSLKDYVELKKSSEKDLELLEKIEKDVKFQKAEAERRKAVQEAKEAGASIEIIQALRDQLKEKSKVEIDINEIKTDIKELKENLKNLEAMIVAFS